MKRIILATRNKGKVIEIKEILKSYEYELVTMDEIGLNIDIKEDGKTYEENALKKAFEINKLTGEIVIADDSGLEIDYLNGAPGIYSARFAGKNSTDDEKNKKILNMLNGIESKDRKAKFVCIIAVVFNKDKKFTVRGICEGEITLREIGNNGFGYDPIFYIPKYEKTTAQMSKKEKNKISHRGKALKKMAEKMRKFK